MIAKQALRIINCFGRLTKPKISNMENVFELMRDKKPELRYIQAMNYQKLHTTKFTNVNQILARELGIQTKLGEEVAATELSGYVYSPISMKPYPYRQKLTSKLQLLATPPAQIPHSPSFSHLKYHYSINQALPQIPCYTPNKYTAYIFNLPHNITQKQLILMFGSQQIKSLKISYCLLGLPAYATVEFNLERYLMERVLDGRLQFEVKGKLCRIVAEAEKGKLELNRRQLVLKDVPTHQTPASMLRTLSQYGRVVHIDVPTQVYKEPSLKQIKQLYKNERNPIRINYHRKNGTIESEYYPPFSPTNPESRFLQKQQEQYRRSLRHSDTIDIYEQKQGEINTRAKGFCVVTFSCQEEAQNCYLQMRSYRKIQLVNGREYFEFDDKHREALLRFIDSSYIQRSLDNDPTSEHDEKKKKQESIFFQSLFMKSVHQKYMYQVYHDMEQLLPSHDEESDIADIMTYRRYLNELKQSVGQAHLNSSSTTNLYGKSFDELAQQQLYGMKLDKKSKEPRYEVNIDDYIRPENTVPPPKKRGRKKKAVTEKLEENTDFQNFDQFDSIGSDDQAQYIQGNTQFSLFKNSQAAELERLQKIQPPAEGKRSFSTMKVIDTSFRKKTLQQKIRSHMLYNKFIRDTINEYMGIFPEQKLQSQFGKKKPTFTNPQNLKFEDGTDFITEYDVKNVLEYSSNMESAQNYYEIFVKENQVVKSLNVDVEDMLLKNFQDNDAEVLYQLTDVGVVKEEYDYSGNDHQGAVKSLNHQAEFGQQYKVVQVQNKKKIVKIAKFEYIYPVQLQQRHAAKVKEFENGPEFDPKKKQALEKYSDYLWNGQVIPDQLAEAFGFEKGKALDAEKLSEQLCRDLGCSKKDLEKLINLKNYTEQQIQQDYSTQLRLLKARQKRSGKKASDYSKDPSKIIIKDRQGKAVVSKFRQI